MFCSHCGEALDGNAKFCKHCGKAISDISPNSEPVKEPVKSPPANETSTTAGIIQDNATAIRIAMASIKSKSAGLSFLLTFFFGPLGLFYSTISGGIIMLFGIPILISLIIGLGTVAGGPIIGIIFLVFGWIICVIWGLIATNRYNSKLLEAATTGEVESVQSTGTTGRSIGLIIAGISIFAIIVITALVYFVKFPDLCERYIQVARNVIGVSQPTDGQMRGFVKLQDIRQRIVNNYMLGNVRIVQGVAVNQANFPIACISVKGAILDAYAVVLGERVSYAGNVLTDEELTNMSEEEILKRLSSPEGSNNSNERVIPNGQIPFMIVFTREPPGSIKTTVMIVGAERLL
jgi:hypothetical protein